MYHTNIGWMIQWFWLTENRTNNTASDRCVWWPRHLRRKCSC